MSHITELNVDNFSHALRGDSGVLVAYFFASWCQPCHSVAPVFEEIAAQDAIAEAAFGTVDMAESPTIAQTYGIRTVPSIAVFTHGALSTLFVGDIAFDEVVEGVKSALASRDG